MPSKNEVQILRSDAAGAVGKKAGNTMDRCLQFQRSLKQAFQQEEQLEVFR